MLGFFRNLSARHTKLKDAIHAYRFPLPVWGQKAMGFVYFTIPVLGGYFVMQVCDHTFIFFFLYFLFLSYIF